MSTPTTTITAADLEHLARLDRELTAIAHARHTSDSEATQAVLAQIYDRTLTEWSALHVRVTTVPIPFALTTTAPTSEDPR